MLLEAAAATIEIVDPRGHGNEDRQGSGPAFGPLAGLRVGLRTDEFWHSWDIASDEWVKLLAADGASCVVYRAPVVHEGELGDESDGTLRAFLESVDAAIVGLCNCGSCSMRAVHDALIALDLGLPTGLVATAHFVEFVRALADHGGRSAVRLTVLPYPLEGLPEEEVRRLAREAYPRLLAELGATR